VGDARDLLAQMLRRALPDFRGRRARHAIDLRRRCRVRRSGQRSPADPLRPRRRDPAGAGDAPRVSVGRLRLGRRPRHARRRRLRQPPRRRDSRRGEGRRRPRTSSSRAAATTAPTSRCPPSPEAPGRALALPRRARHRGPRASRRPPSGGLVNEFEEPAVRSRTLAAISSGHPHRGELDEIRAWQLRNRLRPHDDMAKLFQKVHAHAGLVLAHWRTASPRRCSRSRSACPPTTCSTPSSPRTVAAYGGDADLRVATRPSTTTPSCATAATPRSRRHLATVPVTATRLLRRHCRASTRTRGARATRWSSRGGRTCVPRPADVLPGPAAGDADSRSAPRGAGPSGLLANFRPRSATPSATARDAPAAGLDAPRPPTSSSASSRGPSRSTSRATSSPSATGTPASSTSHRPPAGRPSARARPSRSTSRRSCDSRRTAASSGAATSATRSPSTTWTPGASATPASASTTTAGPATTSPSTRGSSSRGRRSRAGARGRPAAGGGWDPLTRAILADSARLGRQRLRRHAGRRRLRLGGPAPRNPFFA
jgi:hypothetical protein